MVANNGRNKIHLWITGGTIDSEKREGERARQAQTVTMLDVPLTPGIVKNIEEKLKKENPEFPDVIVHKHEVYKDSGKVKAMDILKIANSIANTEGDHHVFTHGTDSMIKNCGKIDDMLKKPGLYRNEPDMDRIPEKIVATTGAMTPLANGADSDGPRNLEFTLRKLGESMLAKKTEDRLKPGLYVGMDDKMRPYDTIEKDYGTGTFVDLKPEKIQEKLQSKLKKKDILDYPVCR